MPADSHQLPPILCLTQDGLPWGHEEQARRLLAAGARWIQLRMKGSDPDTWIATARTVVSLCRHAGARCVVNDSIEVALAADADGVHLSRGEGDWIEARRQIGPDRLLGGTVNTRDDAAVVRACGVLDYVGIGPWRFTATKQALAPVLGPEGVRQLVALCGNLPAWAIGGIQAEDLPEVRATGVRGVAVTGALYHGEAIEENFRALQAAWALTVPSGVAAD